MIGGAGLHMPLPHREPLAKLQHCASLVQLAPSATHVDAPVDTQCEVGGFASGGGSSWHAAVAGDAVPPQQSRLLVQRLAAVGAPGASHAASVKYAREFPARSSCPGR